MNERERFDTLLDVLAELKDANHTIPILVEGQRDVAALRALGCAGEVFPLHNGQGLFPLAEDLSRHTSDVIVLTDWDRKGGILCEQLTTGLTANGVQPDTSFRERMRAWVNLPVKDVESLLPYVKRGLHKFRRTSLEDHARGLAFG